jgi:hydrogenase expression/formation protein HypC
LVAVCLAIPGRIVDFLPGSDEQLALVDGTGVQRKVHLGLLEGERLQMGDYVLIHVGFAMSKIDEREAAETLSLLETMARSGQSAEG